MRWAGMRWGCAGDRDDDRSDQMTGEPARGTGAAEPAQRALESPDWENTAMLKGSGNDASRSKHPRSTALNSWPAAQVGGTGGGRGRRWGAP